MNLDTLKLYCDIARLRSFSQGAALNRVSQSAASQAIQQLESDLEVLLIDRSKRPFMLTPEGERFYEGSLALLGGFEKLGLGCVFANGWWGSPVAAHHRWLHHGDHARFTRCTHRRVRLEYLHLKTWSRRC
jgi:hypothetical protein